MVNKQRIVSAFGFNQTPETQNVFFFYIPLSNYNCQIQVVRSNKNMLTRLLLKYILVLLSIFLRNGIYLHVNFPKKWYISHVNFLLAILNFYSMVNWLFSAGNVRRKDNCPLYCTTVHPYCMGQGYCVNAIFTNISAISQQSLLKPPACGKSLTNFIT